MRRRRTSPALHKHAAHTSLWRNCTDHTAHLPPPCLPAAPQAEALPAGSTKRGVFVTGRVNDFELTGERGTKCPNLSIGQGDVKADVYVRFVFQYDK